MKILYKMLGLSIIFIFLVIFILGFGKAQVDKTNKLTDEKIIEYVKEQMKKEYGKEFTVKLLEKTDLMHRGGAIFSTTHKVKGAFEYTFLVMDEENMQAIVRYTDPYYLRSNNNKTYYESMLRENYKETLTAKEIDSKF